MAQILISLENLMLQGSETLVTPPTTVSPNSSGPAKPPPCTFGGTTGQEQVLLFLISIPKGFKQLIYFSSIEHTFLYLNCKPGCTLLLGKQVDYWYCLCASLFGQDTQCITLPVAFGHDSC